MSAYVNEQDDVRTTPLQDRGPVLPVRRSGQAAASAPSQTAERIVASPVGGKLEQAIGESPTTCAVREIFEETGLVVQSSDLHLTGIVSESGFENRCHWLMFLYEVTRPVEVSCTTFDEGTLEWHDASEIPSLDLPETDRQVIWPLFWRHRGGFFMAHIDCTGPSLAWRVEQSSPTFAGGLR